MRGRAHLLLRLLVVGLVVAAWTEPRLAGGTPLPPVLVLDVSRSMGPGRPGRPPLLEVAPDRYLVGERVEAVRGAWRDHDVPGGGSRLASALRQVAAAHPGRDVLLESDGRSTEADVVAGAAQVASAGGRLFTAPPARPPLDVGLERARVLREGERLAVEAIVVASTPGRATLALVREGTTVAQVVFAVEAGARLPVRLEDPTPQAGAAPYRLTLTPSPGTPDDDRGNDELLVAPPSAEPVVVAIGDIPREAFGPLWGPRVRVVASLDDLVLGGVDVLVLSNLPLALLRAHQGLLRRFVAGGGRLVVWGGPDAGRAGGWSGSAFERELMPLVVRRDPGVRRAWLVALDRSGSMGRGPLVHVRDAVRSLLRSLAPDERLAVLPFAGRPDAAVLAPGFVAGGDAQGAAALETALDAIVAHGDTDMAAAVTGAARLLLDQPARERIVLVLGDGDPDHPATAAGLEAARLALASADARLLAFVSRVERAAEGLRLLAADPRDIAVLDDPGAIRARLEAEVAAARRAEDQVPGPWRVEALEGGALAEVRWPPLAWVHDMELHPEARALARALRLAGAAGTQVLAAERPVGAGAVLALAWGPEALPSGRERDEAVGALVGWLAEQAGRAVPGAEADLVGADLVVGRPTWAGAGRLAVVAADAPAQAPALGYLLETHPGRFRGAAPDPLPDAGLRVRRGSAGEEALLVLPALPPPESRGVGVDLAQLDALALAGRGRRLEAVEAFPAGRPGPGAPLAPWLLLAAVAALLVERFRVLQGRRDRGLTAAGHTAGVTPSTSNRSALLGLMLGLAATVTGACRGTPAARPDGVQASDYAAPPGEDDRPIYLGTEAMQGRVRERLLEVPGASATERQRIGLELVRLGEPAVAPLIASLADPDPSVRVLACFALGQLRDARSLDPIAALLEDPAPGVRYEAATALLRNGDVRGVDALLAALEDRDALARARAIQVLEEVTGQRFGYVAHAREEDRAAALCRWRAWRMRTRMGQR